MRFKRDEETKDTLMPLWHGLSILISTIPKSTSSTSVCRHRRHRCADVVDVDFEGVEESPRRCLNLYSQLHKIVPFTSCRSFLFNMTHCRPILFHIKHGAPLRFSTKQFCRSPSSRPPLLRYLTHTGVGVSPIQVEVSHPYTQQSLTHRTFCF